MSDHYITFGKDRQVGYLETHTSTEIIQYGCATLGYIISPPFTSVRRWRVRAVDDSPRWVSRMERKAFGSLDEAKQAVRDAASARQKELWKQT